MKPGAPLKRKKQMARTPGQRKAPRDTGFPRPVKLAIRARAGNRDPEAAECESCGTWLGRYGGEIQHRSARGAGGCRDEVINGPANGALLCRRCHRICEGRDEHMGMDGAGFWIKHGTTPEFDPRCVSVMWHVRAGSGVTVWLGEDGEYKYESPEARAA